jgi:hypothetical protein
MCGVLFYSITHTYICTFPPDHSTRGGRWVDQEAIPSTLTVFFQNKQHFRFQALLYTHLNTIIPFQCHSSSTANKQPYLCRRTFAHTFTNRDISILADANLS